MYFEHKGSLLPRYTPLLWYARLNTFKEGTYTAYALLFEHIIKIAPRVYQAECLKTNNLCSQHDHVIMCKIIMSRPCLVFCMKRLFCCNTLSMVCLFKTSLKGAACHQKYVEKLFCQAHHPYLYGANTAYVLN